MTKRKISRLIALLFIFGFTFTIAVYPESNDKSIYKQVERIKLNLEKVVFAAAANIIVLPDGGFLVTIRESLYSDLFSLIKLSKNGDVLKIYDKHGNGPGYLQRVSNCLVKENSILVGEFNAPYIHEFSHNLDFIADHRIKKGGKIYLAGKYIGVWHDHITGDIKHTQYYMLALYDSTSYNFKKYAYEVNDNPAYVYSWGNIVKVDEKTFAGVYATEYQIRILDSEFNLQKKLIKDVPDYIVKYTPWKENPHNLDDSGIKWMESWSKIESVYFYEGKFLLKHMIGKTMFIDVIDQNGKTLVNRFKEDKNKNLILADGKYLWLLETDKDSDEPKYVMIKATLDLK